MSPVLLLAKRFASALICLAVVWGAAPLSVRGDLSASRRNDALTFERPSGAAELAPGRVSPQLFACASKSPTHHHEPASADVRAGNSLGLHWLRVVAPATIVAASLAVCARAERGPPRSTLS